MDPQMVQLMNVPSLARRVVRLVSAQVFGLLLAIAAGGGCVTMGPLAPWASAPTGPVCQIVSTWNHEVVFTPDPVNGGVSSPGLVGRVFLFGPDVCYPLVGDGSLTVALFDDSPQADGGQPVQLEEWRIDKDTLRRLVKRDTIGMGYTLFLPWATYKQEIKHIHMKVRYDTGKSLPIYVDSGPLTLSAPETVTSAKQVRSSDISNAGAKPPSPPPSPVVTPAKL